MKVFWFFFSKKNRAEALLFETGCPAQSRETV
jgi:hypothetical protein